MSGIIGNDPTGKQELLDDIAAVDAALFLVDGYTEKVDDLASDGLAGVEDSVAYRAHANEKHHHNFEKWFGDALEDGGYEIAGTTLPDFDGSYFKTGEEGGDSAYTNRDGVGFLWWDGVDSWIVSAVLGTEGTDYFKRTDPSQIGAYTNQGSATGTVTGADIDDENHVADRMDGVIAAFTLTSGNNDFGSWLQVLGSDDTPITAGSANFDLHRIIVTDTTSTDVFIIQIVTGESAGIATKLITEDFNEFPYIAATNNNDSGISEIIDKRSDVGEKVWMRCANVGGNATTLEFYLGIHEYEG